MTAPGAVPEHTTVGELADALRRAVEGDRGGEAAVELLIGHNGTGHWLRREPFLRLVSWYPADDVYPAAAAVDWLQVAPMLESGRGVYDTESERVVLGVAAGLASGPLYAAASSCDAPNRRLVAFAVCRALGVVVS